MIQRKYNWRIVQNDLEMIDNLQKQMKISNLTATVLVNRGITDHEQVGFFINPRKANMHSPFLMADMEKAVERILSAVNNSESILIYGDYDADGVTGTAILYDYLLSIGGIVSYYIPDRNLDGYGLNMDTLKDICEEGCNLIITVDNGISAVEEVEYIKSKGTEVIITDHHECPEEVPEAFAVINPKRHDCGYPFKMLAGVGVAFKLVLAIANKKGQNCNEIFDKYIGIVAIGTIADLVTLTGENRIIVKYGLESMVETHNLGIRAICDEAGIKKVSAWNIAFNIAPRINAAGRIGCARRAVELFTTQDKERAKELAEELGLENKNRQDIEGELVNKIIALIESSQMNKDNIFVIGEEGWHYGVLGIVASRVTEKYCKPCIIISFENGVGRGSGRSIEGVNLYSLMENCNEYLEKFGGHELAGGLTVNEDNFRQFKNKIIALANSGFEEKDFVRKLQIEKIVEPEILIINEIRELKNLEPFGFGNTIPLFCLKDCIVKDVRTIGGDKHLKLIIHKSSRTLETVGFHMGELAKELRPGERLDIVFNADINSYGGRTSVQLIIKDMCTSGAN